MALVGRRVDVDNNNNYTAITTTTSTSDSTHTHKLGYSPDISERESRRFREESEKLISSSISICYSSAEGHSCTRMHSALPARPWSLVSSLQLVAFWPCSENGKTKKERKKERKYTLQHLTSGLQRAFSRESDEHLLEDYKYVA